MFCYIILHYKVLEETISCVKSIKEGNSNTKQIVIIDNFLITVRVKNYKSCMSQIQRLMS